MAGSKDPAVFVFGKLTIASGCIDPKLNGAKISVVVGLRLSVPKYTLAATIY